MAYTKQEWRDGAGGTTPLSAQRLNAIEAGIAAADDAAHAGVPDGSVTDSKVATGRSLVGSGAAWEAIEDRLGTSFLQGGTYDDVAGTWTPNVQSGGGGGSGAFGTLIYVIPASDLTVWPASGTGAQKMAAINANDARIVHELVTRPGYRIEADPSQWWPASLVIDEFVGTYTKPDGTTGNLAEGASYALGGRFLLCKGTRGDSADTSPSVVQSAAVLNITRKSANGGLVVTPALRSVQLGGTPNLGSYFTAVCSGFDVTTNLNLYKAGQLLDLVSKNTYGYSARAGYADGVYKGAFYPIAGLCITVTGYSLTAMNTAIGGGTVTSLERRTIVGVNSGVTALVQGGDFGANGQLLVNSVSGNWSANEQIKDQATGAVVATYVSTTVCMAGSLNCDYDDTAQIRFVTRSSVDVGRMMIKPDGDPDDVIESFNRPDVLGLTGCTGVILDGIRVLGGYAAGIVLRSCFDISGMAYVRDLPNHAIETEAAEKAYGYALRFLGHCQNFSVKLDVGRVRHGPTSNAIRGSWNLNARTGSTTGATSLCTNFWNHGPGMRRGVLSGKVENTWSACWDFHEGAEDVLLDHPQAIQPMGSGRSTTAPDGFSIRGFGITILNPYAEGCRIGVYDLAGPLNSGGLAYRNSVIGGVFNRCQAAGYMQSEDVFDESLARHDVIGNVFHCDPAARGAYQQFGLLLRRGNTTVTNNKVASVGYAMMRMTSFVGSGGSNATGHVLIRGNEFDFTDSTASRLFSDEATFDEIAEFDNHARANPIAGTQRPLFRHTNSGGDSNILFAGATTSHLSSTKSNPAPSTVTAGSPTITSVDPAGGAAGHSTATAPTLVAQANAGTGPTTVLASGSTDVSGEVRITTGTTPASGALVRVNYGTAFAADVFPVVAPGLNAHTRALGVTSHDATGFTVQFGNAPGASTEYRFTYYVPGI